jgi:helix-turn-helix protein
MAKGKGDRMLTTAEVAEILDAAPSSIRVWLNEKGHPRFPNAQKFGHVWMIPASDLEGMPQVERGRPKKEVEKGSKRTAKNTTKKGATK